MATRRNKANLHKDEAKKIRLGDPESGFENGTEKGGMLESDNGSAMLVQEENQPTMTNAQPVVTNTPPSVRETGATGEEAVQVSEEGMPPDSGETLATNPTFITTPEVLGLRALGLDGLVAQDNGQFSIVCRLDSADVKMMSALEKTSLVEAGTDFLNTLSRPVSFYSIIEPGDIQPFLSELANKRRLEPDLQMKQNFFIEEDHLKQLAGSSNLTERTAFFALSATRAELKGLELVEHSRGSSKRIKAGDMDAAVRGEGILAKSQGQAMEAERLQPESEEEQEAVGGVGNAGNKLLGFLQKRWQEVVEPDEEQKAASTNDVEEHHSGIPPVMAEGLKFTAASMGDALSRLGMNGQLLPRQGLTNQLARRLASPFANYPATPPRIREQSRKLLPLVRAGGADFFETPDYVRFRNPSNGVKRYAATLYLTRFPNRLPLGALEQLVCIKDIPLQIALHVTPWDTLKAKKKLKNREQILIAARLNDQSLSGDLDRDNSQAGVRRLREKLSKGEGKIFKVGLRVAVIAPSLAQLKLDLRRVLQRLQEMGYGVATATRNQRRAFLSTLPTGRDFLSEGRFLADRTTHTNMTGENVICLLPNIVPNHTQKGGIIIGINRADGSLVTFNRWVLVSPHTSIIATTGSGKTVAMMVEIMRELQNSPELQCLFIDPQGVMKGLCRLTGGVELDLGINGRCIINPLDRYVLNGKPEELSQRLTFLYPLFELMIKATITAADRNAIRNALERLYQHFEQGESMLQTLAASFSTQRLFQACRPYVLDYQDEANRLHRGIISRLTAIYAELGARHAIPHTGFVAGREEMVTVEGYEDTGSKAERTVTEKKLKFESEAGTVTDVGQAVNAQLGLKQAEEMVEGFQSATAAGNTLKQGTEVFEGFEQAADVADSFTAIPTGFKVVRKRPVCAYSSQEQRFYYRGEGETTQPLPEGSFEPHRQYGAIPPAVWYPDPDWIRLVYQDFYRLLRQPDEFGQEVFWMLDKTARTAAIRDAFVELKRGMPVLSDLLPFLAAERLNVLVESLENFVSPSGYGAMFNGFTNVRLDKRLIVFNVLDLDRDDLRAIRMFQVIDYTWSLAKAVKRPRLFIADEFGLLCKHQDVGNYISNLFRRGRAFFLSMTAIVQNITNLLDYEAGLVCLELSERLVLMRQTEIAIERLRERFRLTGGHVNYLLRARNGECLQIIDGRRVRVKYDVPDLHLPFYDTRPNAEQLSQAAGEEE